MKVLNISQGYGSESSTHKLSYALDLSGNDAGKDNVYAPFDAVVTKLYQPKDIKKHATTVWLTSTKKVLSPNGYYGYLTVSITHPNEILKMKIGTKYKQGDLISTEGKTGNATGNHIHLEVAVGKKANWVKKVKGKYSEYVIVNAVKPTDYLFAKDDAIIKNNVYKGKKYYFIKEKNITYKVNDNAKIYKDFNRDEVIKTLKKDDEVIKFYERDSWSYIYHYEKMGYVKSSYLSKL